MPPDIIFLASPLGGGIAVLISVVAGLIAIRWATHPIHRDRRLVLGAAAVTTLAQAALNVLAYTMGWWGGRWFGLPLVVQLAINLPLALAGWTLWLLGYRWVGRHTRRPLVIDGLVALTFIGVIVTADLVNLQRGQFTLGGGYTVAHDVLVGEVVLWLPILVFEGLQRRRTSGSTEANR